MASGAQQLQTDFELVQKLLGQYRNIKLLRTEGDPPDRYDIEYRIKGYKSNPDGTASPENTHQVRISLPFGYPHFPPTAKPLTPIFHPDIDPDAIRIADFWQNNNSLPDLIIHIGKMICGEIYGANESFNQRAFDWYEERKSWMPFDILEPYEADEDETEEETAGEMAVASDTPADEDLTSLQAEDTAFQFELEDEGGETDSAGGELEDWTALQEEDSTLDINLDEAGDDLLGSLDLSGLEQEVSTEDFSLDQEEPGQAVDLTDLGAEELEDLPDTFDLGVEPETDLEDNLDLGDLSGIGEEDLGDLSGIGEEDIADTFSLDEEPAPAGDILEAAEAPPGEDEDEVLDFGIADTSHLPLDEEQEAEPAETETEDEGELDGMGLQLDEDADKKYGGQARSIRPLIEQKEIFTAKKVLADIPNPSSVPDYEELEHTISSAISEAEGLYKKADKLEQKGQLEKAGLVLDLVANIATDYPGLEFARNRIRESMMAEGQKKPGPADEGEGEEQVSAEGKPAKKKKGRAALGFKVPYTLIAAVLILGSVGAGGAMLYTRDSENLHIAQTKFHNGEELVQKIDFKEAQREFTAARTALNNILVLHRSKKGDLQKQIDDIVNSQSFKEGLQGRVLQDGQYVTVEAAKAIDRFKILASLAEQELQAGKIDQAIESYEKSLEFAQKGGLQEQQQNIIQTINTLRFQQTLAQARKAEEENEWKQAADTYQKALELSSSLSKPEDQADISQRLAAASFRHELDESKRAFTSSEWQKTVDMLNRAQKILEDNPTIASAEEQKELSKLLVNSRLFHILAGAKKAFEQNEWEPAIAEYRTAITLLQENAEILGEEEVSDSLVKIDRTILMTQITREQNQITSAARDNDLESTMHHYEAIIALIDKSPFKDDDILKKIVDNARTQIVAVEKELLINRRIEWLKENYEQIFRENYPSAKSSELLHPKVTFIKREENVMIFNMSCAERKQGRSFRLELNYQYDLDSDKWKLYSGKL